MDIDTFINIFSQEQYRKKLDHIILNFFGLENGNKVENTINRNQNILEFIVCIEKQFIFKIIILDYQNLFSNSKQFYVNFSFEKNSKNYTLLYPCYWEVYCNTCLSAKKRYKEIEILGAILASSSLCEIEELLKDLKQFTNFEIKELLLKIRKSHMISKDK